MSTNVHIRCWQYCGKTCFSFKSYKSSDTNTNAFIQNEWMNCLVVTRFSRRNLAWMESLKGKRVDFLAWAAVKLASARGRRLQQTCLWDACSTAVHRHTQLSSTPFRNTSHFLHSDTPLWSIRVDCPESTNTAPLLQNRKGKWPRPSRFSQISSPSSAIGCCFRFIIWINSCLSFLVRLI